MSENINISKKITLFEIILKKIVFCPNCRKYQHIEENYVILRSFENAVFCPYVSPKTLKFSRKGRTLHRFLPIAPKIAQIQRKVTVL